MEAHTSELRGLALSADGSKLATASIKGTVIRVWDVASSTCIQEFRRGVERATITCLSWSWDNERLCCTSDKGTAHVFQMGNNDKKDTSTNNENSSLTQMLFSTVRKSVEGDAKKSICQIRGIPHPLACTFVSDSPNVVAVAGWDADGNGVLLLSEFDELDEAKRIGYYVVCKSPLAANANETDEARRRRRLRGTPPTIPETPEGGRLLVGDRLEMMENGIETIEFEDTGDSEFVSVNAKFDSTTTEDTKRKSPIFDTNQVGHDGEKSVPNNCNAEEKETSSNQDSGTVGDSVRTEPLDDEGEHAGED